MQLRYHYRVDPEPRHVPGFARAFGCTRFVFNDALAFREAAYASGQPYPGHSDLSARLTAIKAAPERAWLNEEFWTGPDGNFPCSCPGCGLMCTVVIARGWWVPSPGTDARENRVR